MAALVKTLGDPIGEGILAITQALRQYGLCVFAENAMFNVKALVTAIDIGATDHPRETAEEIDRLVAAIDQALNPPKSPL